MMPSYRSYAKGDAGGASSAIDLSSSAPRVTAETPLIMMMPPRDRRHDASGTVG